MGACFSKVFNGCPLKIHSAASWINPDTRGLFQTPQLLWGTTEIFITSILILGFWRTGSYYRCADFYSEGTQWNTFLPGCHHFHLFHILCGFLFCQLCISCFVLRSVPDLWSRGGDLHSEPEWAPWELYGTGELRLTVLFWFVGGWSLSQWSLGSPNLYDLTNQEGFYWGQVQETLQEITVYCDHDRISMLALRRTGCHLTYNSSVRHYVPALGSLQEVCSRNQQTRRSETDRRRKRSQWRPTCTLKRGTQDLPNNSVIWGLGGKESRSEQQSQKGSTSKMVWK